MRTRIPMGLFAAILLAALAVGTGSAQAAHVSQRAVHHPSVSYLKSHFTAHRSCSATPAKGSATCGARHLVVKSGLSAAAAKSARKTAATVSGLTPANIQSAYQLSGLSTGSTVAIVDAYGYPNAAANLATYRAQFGLPACTTASGCLKIVNQTGGTTLPAFNLGWSQEQALDLDAVSAACPSCKILLVQAKTASFANLGTAVNTAAAGAGVKAVSNSYGGGDASDATYSQYYKHLNVAVTASAGDDGYQGASYPASSQYVTAVGGTSLTTSSSTRGWNETVWSGTGSGCSSLNAHPSGQTTTMTGCSGRNINDVAAVADPNTGLAVYAPTSRTAATWAQYGGTSLSSPIIASVFALSGNTSGYSNRLPYANPSALNDVTSGSNGTCATFCTAKAGYDAPTGLGTPAGVGAF